MNRIRCGLRQPVTQITNIQRRIQNHAARIVGARHAVPVFFDFLLGLHDRRMLSQKPTPLAPNSPRLCAPLCVLCVKAFLSPPASDYPPFVTFLSRPISTQRLPLAPHLTAYIALPAPKNRLQSMKLSPTFYVFMSEDTVKLNVAEKYNDDNSQT
jgi:hypothetical protein